MFYAVALSMHGKTAYGGGRDGYLYVWDTSTGNVTHILAPPPLPAPPHAAKKPVHHPVKKYIKKKYIKKKYVKRNGR